MSSAIPGSEDLITVAPDSFENDQCEVKKCSQAGQVQGAVKTDQSTLGTHFYTYGTMFILIINHVK